MNAVKRFYAGFVKAEELLACVLLACIVTLMFLSAVMRKLGVPLNWAGDTSLLLFTWTCFFGADLAVREKSLVNVDMLLTRFPKRVQKIIRIACQIASMALLISFVLYGVPLCIDSVARKFSNMDLSYSWATASVPAGSALLTVTMTINLLKMFRSETGTYGKQEGNDIC